MPAIWVGLMWSGGCQAGRECSAHASAPRGELSKITFGECCGKEFEPEEVDDADEEAWADPLRWGRRNGGSKAWGSCMCELNLGAWDSDARVVAAREFDTVDDASTRRSTHGTPRLSALTAARAPSYGPTRASLVRRITLPTGPPTDGSPSRLSGTVAVCVLLAFRRACSLERGLLEDSPTYRSPGSDLDEALRLLLARDQATVDVECPHTLERILARTARDLPGSTSQKQVVLLTFLSLSRVAVAWILERTWPMHARGWAHSGDFPTRSARWIASQAVLSKLLVNMPRPEGSLRR